MFIQRAELASPWTFVVYLECEPEETLRRALVRDRERLGGRAVVVERHTRRYLPAQAAYRDAVDPETRADLVLRT